MGLRDTVQELLRNMVQGHPSVVDGTLVGGLDKSKSPNECSVRFFDPSAGIMREEDKVPFITSFLGLGLFANPVDGDRVLIAFRNGDTASPKVIDWHSQGGPPAPQKTTNKLDNG